MMSGQSLSDSPGKGGKLPLNLSSLTAGPLETRTSIPLLTLPFWIAIWDRIRGPFRCPLWRLKWREVCAMLRSRCTKRTTTEPLTTWGNSFPSGVSTLRTLTLDYLSRTHEVVLARLRTGESPVLGFFRARLGMDPDALPMLQRTRRNNELYLR